MTPPPGSVRVVMAGELLLCACCGEELWCPVHEEHYADCPCVGPHSEGYDFCEVGGVLYAVPQGNPCEQGA